MATTRHRHMITETDDIAAALRDAAARWPGLSNSQLLRQLIIEGHTSLRTSAETELAAVEATSGALTSIYRDNELELLRADWPA